MSREEEEGVSSSCVSEMISLKLRVESQKHFGSGILVRGEGFDRVALGIETTEFPVLHPCTLIVRVINV